MHNNFTNGDIFAPQVAGIVSVTCTNLVQNFNDFRYILFKMLNVKFFVFANIEPLSIEIQSPNSVEMSKRERISATSS